MAKYKRDCIMNAANTIRDGLREEKNIKRLTKDEWERRIVGAVGWRLQWSTTTIHCFKSWWWWRRKPNVQSSCNVHTPTYAAPRRASTQQMINWMEFFADITRMHSQFSPILQSVCCCCFVVAVAVAALLRPPLPYSFFSRSFSVFYVHLKIAYWANTPATM